MKVAITGHTRGIGKELSQFFKSQGYEVIGFSKSNGFDIEDPENRRKIIEASVDCDVFVNNAFTHNSNSQLLILKSIKELWQGKDKLIINIGSRASDSINDPKFPWPTYARLKYEQEIFCNVPSKFPWMMNLKPGSIDTDMTADQQIPKMNVSDVTKVLKFALENKDSFRLKSATFTL